MIPPAKLFAEIAEEIAGAFKKLRFALAGRMNATARQIRKSQKELENADRSLGDMVSDSTTARTDHFGDGVEHPRSPRTSFSAEMRSTEAREIDATLAKLADDVYIPGHVDRIDGFARLTDSELEQVGIPAEAMNDPISGLTTALYRDEQGRHVLAFAGTDHRSLKSWKANLYQGAGLRAHQYVLAGRLGKLARVAFGNNLVLTGHSLGGGLAVTAALKSGAPAVTFNSAGLSDRTIRGLKLEPDAARRYAAAGNVRSYVVAGDPLTELQESHRARRATIGGFAGGLVGSALGGALGAVVGSPIDRAAGSVAGRRLGSVLGAAMGGSAAATVTAGGLARVQPALGARINLPDPLSPDEYGGRRLTRALELHKMTAVQRALADVRPWSKPSPSDG
ncbi:Mbeg1-like protein [Nocardia brevicatena]|uniref:Mbeg1-like protein n=1 Tax=Nocardia brevicatena TaxID=37327 RepID=UPI0003030EA2|nr:Mbeg1-like protein [Nocardia brevicatena]